MKAKILKVVFINNGTYDICHITIDKTLDKTDTKGNHFNDNTINISEYTAHYFGINEYAVGLSIDFDIIQHKAGEHISTECNDDYVFKNNCVEYRVNKVTI